MATVSDLILKHRSDILGAWTDAARKAPAAKHLDAGELAGLMPEYLALLGDETPEPDAHLSAVQRALIERHLSNRLRAGFNLSEIVTEFAMIGRCVSAFLDVDPSGDRPTAADAARLYARLYQTTTAVTQIFNEHLLEDEQTMKRYGRLLEHIANDPLAHPERSAPLRSRLGDVLELILEATDARAAVLLLFNGATGQLTAAASMGAGAAELEPYARTLEATASAPKEGASGTEAAEIKASAALRGSGIGSLLRIRLASRDTLRCVLYVGIEEERRFTASEVRRLEGLSGALTVHLDNAQLRGSLQQKLQELRVERELRERVISVLIRDIRGPLAAARAKARRLAADPASVAATAPQIVETLGSIENVVDDFLAMTPAMPRD